MTDPTPDEALAHAHRQWYGRLVGWVFRVTGDLQLAEDAVAAAFVSAVAVWRRDGVPRSAEAWLRVVARNEAMTALRRTSRTVTVDPATFPDWEAPGGADGSAIDDRLELLFVCAHPAIDRRMHAPLMLQSVLGVDAARIGAVYLVPASTMGQRLSRAKAKIREAGIRFRVPDPEEFPARLGAVLAAVYAAYGIADPSGTDDEARGATLRAETLRLAEVLTELLPTEAETWGLRSLLLHTESRRPGRIVDGVFVPLAEQDTTLWSVAQRRLADDCLRRAGELGVIGRFQLEAAISAIHSARADGVATDWTAIVDLYRGLSRIGPSIGATIGAATALTEVGRLEDAVALLDTVPPDAVVDHQPYWVCRARVARLQGDGPTAARAAERALGLTTHAAVRAHLLATLISS